MPARIDTTTAPIIVQTFTGDLELPDLMRYLHQKDQLLQGPKFVSIVVASKLRKAETQAIQQHVYWFRKNWDLCQRQWLGVAFVFEQVLPRFLFSLYSLVSKLPMPYIVTDRFEEGLAWTLEILAKNHIPLPEHLPTRPIL